MTNHPAPARVEIGARAVEEADGARRTNAPPVARPIYHIVTIHPLVRVQGAIGARVRGADKADGVLRHRVQSAIPLNYPTAMILPPVQVRGGITAIIIVIRHPRAAAAGSEARAVHPTIGIVTTPPPVRVQERIGVRRAGVRFVQVHPPHARAAEAERARLLHSGTAPAPHALPMVESGAMITATLQVTCVTPRADRRVRVQVIGIVIRRAPARE